MEKNNKFIITNIITYIFVIFLAVNVSIWTTVMVKSVAFGPHKKAKFVLANSMYLTVFYIFPIGKVLGPDVAILKPIRQVRDNLYYSGVKLLPSDDAESEMWWYATRYKDFVETYTAPKVMEYARGHINEKEAGLDYLLKFTDEMYYHLEKMALTQNLEDKYFKTLRFKIFTNQVAFEYVNDRMLMLNRKYHGNIPKKEFKKLENVWKYYLSLKEYCKKNEKKGYDRLFSNKEMKSSEVILGYLIVNFVLNENIKEGKFACNNVIANENAIVNYKDAKYLLNEVVKQDTSLLYEKDLLNNEQFDFSRVAKKIETECKYIKPTINQEGE